MPRLSAVVPACVIGLVFVAPVVAQPPVATAFVDHPTPEQVAFFEKKIRPVLVEHCYKCHSAGAEKVRGELRLDTRAGVRAGGAGGPVIVPGRPDRSPLIRALRSSDPAVAMPPRGKLPEAVIADFEAWVRMGAPDPRDGSAGTAPPSAPDLETGRQFWAFRPPVKPVVPEPPPGLPTGTDIDRFLVAAQARKGIRPNGPADPRTLLRRLYLDLIGLPPTSEEVEAFVADAKPDAYERVVDRLLASPHFGERWGRHWLDVARYAESSGKAVNMAYPHAWRYRDYVIAAFNADKPYDQFVKEQLAGDLLPTPDPKLRAERLVASGFLAIGPKLLNERNGLQFELDLADEQVDVTTQAFLGLTVACARCHDHKFDPISQRDYYALAGIFRSTETCYGTVRFIQAQRPSPLLPLPKDCGLPPGTDETLTAAARARLEQQIEELTRQMAEATDPIRRIFPAGQIALLRSRLDAFDAEGHPKLLAMGVRDKPPPRGGFGRFGGPRPGGFAGPFGGTLTVGDSPIYARGEPDKPSAERVPRGVPQVLTTRPLRIPPDTSGRLQLAEWIASRDNPLTARVLVNRVWLHLFGRGLVPTADNFGAAGQPPTHPELLDYLAVTFMDDGWSVKRLIRRLVLTDAYRRDSRFETGAFAADPDNTLLWRMTPRRLDAESLRDSLLAVSGRLDPAPPRGSAVARAGEGPVGGFLGRGRLGANPLAAANDPSDRHRSVYLPILRDNLPEVLALFDAPDPSLIAADRPTTTVPAQGLFLLNNPFVLRCAEAAADRLLARTSSDTERVREAYLGFYGRPPSEAELAAAQQFLRSYSAQLARDRVPARAQPRETWAAFCQALFASAEFQYRR